VKTFDLELGRGTEKYFRLKVENVEVQRAQKNPFFIFYWNFYLFLSFRFVTDFSLLRDKFTRFDITFIKSENFFSFPEAESFAWLRSLVFRRLS
jgi:hypothetical protein